MTHASRSNPLVGFTIFIAALALIVASLFLLTNGNDGSTPGSDDGVSTLNDDADDEIDIDGDHKVKITKEKKPATRRR